MIIGVGNDILEVARMKRELEQGGSGFRNEIFAAGEIAYCEGQRYPARHYAARFAAKEAFLKALGTGLGSALTWREAEVHRGPAGEPGLILSGEAARRADQRGVKRIFLSLTHTADLAMATVVLEGQAPLTTGQRL
jgi:holo-[acyl-carrier protein] synthase